MQVRPDARRDRVLKDVQRGREQVGVTTEPGETADPAGFRPHIPPGTRVVEESGHPLVDATAGYPA